MKKVYMTLLLTAAALAPLKGVAQDEKQMQAWEAYMTPGEAHRMMAAEEGTWNCQMTFWMEPGGKPESYKSVAEIKMIMGGRYQEATYAGDMMGMPFQGKATTAFNNASKEYTMTWIDNMGTGIMVSNGSYDPETRSVVSKGEMVNPMDRTKTQFREVYSYVDENTRKIEMFDTKGGKEYKSMEILMKRVK